MKEPTGRATPQVPSRDQLVDLFQKMPLVRADSSALKTAADHVRRVFRQPGRDDLSLMLRTPTGAWAIEPETNCSVQFIKLANQIEKLRELLRQLPSAGWQILDGAELAALTTLYSDQQMDGSEDVEEPRIRRLLENLVDHGDLIDETLAFAYQFSRAGGVKYLTEQFAEAAAYAFHLLTGKHPTRRYDPYNSIEHGPFYDFVDALRLAFNHPTSTATLVKVAVQRWRKTRRMDDRKQKSR